MEEWKDIKSYEGLYQVSNLRKSKEFEQTRNERENFKAMERQKWLLCP